MEDFTSYNLLKYTHIFSAFLLFGTGLGSAFYKWMSDLSGNLAHQAIVAKHVVLADWLFTTPTIIIQPLTGWLLMRELGIELTEPWVLLSFALYALAGICWLPVVHLQIKMRDMAQKALKNGQQLPPEYKKMARLWFWLGWPAFFSLTIAVWLMIAKPEFTFIWSQ